MEFGCPVCNGFTTISKNCPRCQGGLLEDKGTLGDFYGPYSPYEDQDFYESSEVSGKEEGSCLHLLGCSVCGHDERVSVCQIVM